MAYRIEVSPLVYRNLDRLKKRIQVHDFNRLRNAIRGLVDEPRPHRARTFQSRGFLFVLLHEVRLQQDPLLVQMIQTIDLSVVRQPHTKSNFV